MISEGLVSIESSKTLFLIDLNNDS